MTVGELIRHLKDFPKDMLVVVDGYEDGFEDAVRPKMLTIQDDYGCPTTKDDFRYMGRYSTPGGFGVERQESTIDAVVIQRPDCAEWPE